jgi:hypothetical protein
MKRDDMTPEGIDSRTRYRGRRGSEREGRKKTEKKEKGLESGGGNDKRSGGGR